MTAKFNTKQRRCLLSHVSVYHLGARVCAAVLSSHKARKKVVRRCVVYTWGQTEEHAENSDVILMQTVLVR